MGAFERVRENLFERVSDLFHDLDMGMQPISVVFPYLPIEAHRRRDRARVELSSIFAKARRRRFRRPPPRRARADGACGCVVVLWGR